MKFFHHGFLVLIISGASLLGCRESKTNSPPAIVRGTPVSPVEEAKPEAIHPVKFSCDAFGQKGSMNSGLNEVKPHYGLGGTAYSSTSEPQGVLTEFQFELVEHQNGSDVYRVTRSVTGGEHDGKSDIVDVKYSGKKVSVFDDDISVAVMEPSEAK